MRGVRGCVGTRLGRTSCGMCTRRCLPQWKGHGGGLCLENRPSECVATGLENRPSLHCSNHTDNCVLYAHTIVAVTPDGPTTHQSGTKPACIDAQIVWMAYETPLDISTASECADSADTKEAAASGMPSSRCATARERAPRAIRHIHPPIVHIDDTTRRPCRAVGAIPIPTAAQLCRRPAPGTSRTTRHQQHQQHQGHQRPRLSAPVLVHRRPLRLDRLGCRRRAVSPHTGAVARSVAHCHAAHGALRQ